MSEYDLSQIILPAADHLARVFGFQQRQNARAHAGEMYSNTACQVSRISDSQRVQRPVAMATTRRLRCDQGPARTRSVTTSTGASTSISHSPMLISSSQGGWPRRRGSPRRAAVADELGAPRLILFYLMYGEAANLRLLPKRSASSPCCAAAATSRAARHAPPPCLAASRTVGRAIVWGSRTARATAGLRPPLARSSTRATTSRQWSADVPDLKAEIQGRKNEPSRSRHVRRRERGVLAPCDLSAILKLAKAGKAADEYDALRATRPPGGARTEGHFGTGRKGRKRRLFTKTYTERVSFGHVLFTFSEWSRCISSHPRPYRARLCRPVGLGMDLYVHHAGGDMPLPTAMGCVQHAERYCTSIYHTAAAGCGALLHAVAPAHVAAVLRDAACACLHYAPMAMGMTLFELACCSIWFSLYHHCAPHAVDH